MLKDIKKLFTVNRHLPKWYKIFIMTALVIMLIYIIHIAHAAPIYLWIAIPINYWALFEPKK